MSNTDVILLGARQRISSTEHRMMNEKTGCYGVAVRATKNSRADITIHHVVRCNCLDVHLIHLHQHAQATYKRSEIKRGRRDDLIMGTKLRLPNMDYPIKIPQPRKAVNPEEAGSYPARVVEELISGQLLIEEWDSEEAWRSRKICKDW